MRISNFAHFPRTGGTFITDWLNACGLNPPKKMKPASEMKNAWGVIRNPFDVYVSWYYLRGGKNFEGFLKRLLNGEINYYWTNPKQLKKHDIGMATYCFAYFFCDHKVFDDIENLGDYQIAKVIKYQHNLREAIKREIKLTSKESKLLGETERQKVSKGKKPFETYYTPELINLIKHKDRYLFRLYPEYECDSNKSG